MIYAVIELLELAQVPSQQYFIWLDLSAEQVIYCIYNLSSTYLCSIFPIISSMQKSLCVLYPSLVTQVLSTFSQYFPCLQSSSPSTPEEKYFLFLKSLLQSHLLRETFLNPPSSAHLIPDRFCRPPPSTSP